MKTLTINDIDVTNIPDAARAVLPETTRHPVNAPYVLLQNWTLWKSGNNYSLDYDDVTAELVAALNMGLQDYGSGSAQWEIPGILRSPNGSNHIRNYWTLYVYQVCGGYSWEEVDNAWNQYTPQQVDFITGALTRSLDGELEYILDQWNLWDDFTAAYFQQKPVDEELVSIAKPLCARGEHPTAAVNKATELLFRVTGQTITLDDRAYAARQIETIFESGSVKPWE